ncbi:MAG: metalloregulator ArsR/SmtB family transcription factor [Anaeromyxobacter sp.]
MITDKNALARAHYAELARIGKVLGSPVRLLLLDLLRQGPRSVETLAEAAGLPVANASQHLQHMRRARVIAAEQRGRFTEYRLAAENVSAVFAALRLLAEDLLPEMDRLRTELSVLAPEDREELLEAIRLDVVTLVDVRPVEEFRAGHLPGAHSIPLAELHRRLDELPRGRELVAYCRGPYCTLAVTAVRILEQAGFRARHLDLGVPDLKARRFRIASGDATPPRRAAPSTRSALRTSKPTASKSRISKPGTRTRSSR